MAQHDCVARFYDEHTQDVCNSGTPTTVAAAMKIAERMLEDGRTLSADYETLQADNQRFRQWIADLHTGVYINCIYCGYRFGPNPGTPVAMVDNLREHIEVCPDHPLAQLRVQMEAEATMPCYLCAVPGKDERCRTTVCGACGERLRKENEELQIKLLMRSGASEREARGVLRGETEDD